MRQVAQGRRLLAVLVLTGAVLLVGSTAALAHDGPGTSATPDAACATVAGQRLCTHGPDAAAPGVDVKRAPSPAAQSADLASGSAQTASVTAASAPSVACIGDGRSGRRVHAIYAHRADKASRYRGAAPLIREYAARADEAINRSAGQRGAGRRIRFLTKRCKPVVSEVAVPRRIVMSGNLFELASHLSDKGFARSDRKYVVWMDAAVLCGVGTGNLRDHRRSTDNSNNTMTGYARIDRACWGGPTELHELLHTLGAVQMSAPNSSGYGHCTDEYDVMCYPDGPGVTMRMRCPGAIQAQVDCGHNDYFNPKPKAGSYLAGHWNTADSGWLQTDAPPPTEPVLALPRAADRLPGLAWSVSATSRAAGGRTIASWRWSSDRPECRFSDATRANTTFWCVAHAGGPISLSVVVTDSAGVRNVTSKQVMLASAAPPREVSMVVSQTPSPTVTNGVVVTARLTDVLTRKPVIGARVNLSVPGTRVTKPTTRTGTVRHTFVVAEPTSGWVEWPGAWSWGSAYSNLSLTPPP